MERRKAITAAAAASLTLLAGAAGIAVNSGIVGATEDGDVGQLSPVATTTAPPITLYVDDPAPTLPTTAPTVRPTDAQPTTTSAASSHQDDDDLDEDDDRFEDEDRFEDQDDDEVERESEEHEGADDDD